MKYITAIILALTMTAAIAAPIKIGFSHRMEREDGTPLDISEIMGTNIYFGVNGGVWYIFMLPVDTMFVQLQTSPNEFCVQFETVLHDLTHSEPSEWLCFTNTPKEAP